MFNEIVIHQGPDASPPKWAIDFAVGTACMSPCQKRKVGISVYRCIEALGSGIERTERTGISGFNGPPVSRCGTLTTPPASGHCDGSKACRDSCGRRCVHAEFRAIDTISTYGRRYSLTTDQMRMVHVKLDGAGKLIPNDGPSCVECSKHILDVGVGGIWLYQDSVWHTVLDAQEREAIEPRWIYYDAERFHRETCVRLGVY